MKCEYKKPAIEVVDIETKATFMIKSWDVDGGKNPDDHGYIIEDKGEGGKYPDNYDPWKSDNW